MTPRILLAGLFHETHTFLEGLTPLEAFTVRRDEQLLACAGDGSPLAAAVEAAQEYGWQLLPLVDYRATPSATVADEVLEQYWSELQRLALPQLEQGVHGMLWVLHGAMATPRYPDAEGEILQRFRLLPGAGRIPICAVTDLHGNISPRMTSLLDGLSVYRENPHIDAHQAARRAATHLQRLLSEGRRAHTLLCQAPLIWPPTGTATADEPMRSLEAAARTYECANPDLLEVCVFAGFSFADTYDTGVSFAASTFGPPAAALDVLRRLSAMAVQQRAEGLRLAPPLESVMPQVLSLLQAPETDKSGPILLVEPADNIGGGAPGDGTAVLRALLAHGLQEAAVAINDPQAVAALADALPGGPRRVAVGGKGSRLDPGPLELEVVLIRRTDGRFRLLDPHSHLASMCGTQADMGPTALVRAGGVYILLTSRKTPPFDLGQWTSVGLDPRRLRVIGVKAAVAHRRAYDPIARASFTVDTPGPCSSTLQRFPYRRLRRPIWPLDELAAHTPAQ
ncbi:MAG: M81 family metallopeptidase [Pirellulales bacterium]|nr:M81 family metallopeptidase [Pirellulales bacterium]